MKMKLAISAITVLLTIATAAENAHPSSEPVRQVRFRLGGGHYQVRDDIVAPLRWDGVGPVGALSYTFVGDGGRHAFELQVPFVPFSNRYDHEGWGFEINLRYGYLRRISGNESQGQIHIGGRLEWSLNTQFYEIWDDSHMYWLNAYQLGPAARWSKIMGPDHRLAVGINFPVLALVSRPPKYRYYDQEKLPKEIFSKPHEDMEFTNLPELLSFGLRCVYTRPVGNKLALETTYLLNYKTFAEPERISILANTLLLALIFTPGTN